ncbi:MAG: GAF domain-containing protein, partial [Nitrospinaceae bacterium]
MILCKEDIHISPEVLEGWQKLLNALANRVGVPAALITRIDKGLLEIFLANQSTGPYPPGKRVKLTGRYCEHVIKHQKQLLVPNALQDPYWGHNPIIKLGIISYLGFPLKWPDGEVFGTLCILDREENHFDTPIKAHSAHFKDLAETQLDLIFKNEEQKRRIEGYQRTGEILKNNNKKQEKLLNQLNWILEGTSSHFGSQYFKALVTALAEVLGAQYVLIGRFSGEELDRVETLANYCNGRVSENFSYSLVGTPCQKILTKGICTYAANVQSLFPEDRDLKDLNVESYSGVPLLDSNQRVVGLMVVMDSKAIDDPKAFETILSIFSHRAQAELIRQILDEALEKKRREEQTILDSYPAFIIFKDTQNNILRVNKKVAASLGIKPEDMVGRNSADFFPNEASRYFQDDLEVMRTGRDKTGIIEPYQLPNGEKRWVKTDKIPIKDDGGEIVGILVFSLDVTDRKLTEDELENYRHHLETLVRKRTQELTLAMTFPHFMDRLKVESFPRVS